MTDFPSTRDVRAHVDAAGKSGRDAIGLMRPLIPLGPRAKSTTMSRPDEALGQLLSSPCAPRPGTDAVAVSRLSSGGVCAHDQTSADCASARWPA